MSTQNALVGHAAMLIRKPVANVFDAFINPAITTQFWFTHSTGRLEVGKQIRWDWEMYNVSVNVDVKAIEENKRILIEWSSPPEPPTTVEWVFTPHGDGATFLTITNSGFMGDPSEIAKQAINSTSGFTLVIVGLKALLEHNIQLNLIADRFPSGLGST